MLKTAFPMVQDRLHAGLAVDVDQQGVFPRWIEVRRLDAPGVELHAAADIDAEELAGHAFNCFNLARTSALSASRHTRW